MKGRFDVVVCYTNDDLFNSLRENLKDMDCRLFPVCNMDNRYSIPQAYNKALKESDADYLVFLHQDVVLPAGWFDTVERQIKEVEKIDGLWGVVGIIGLERNGFFAGHIFDPHTRRQFGELPREIVSLDEVCLILRRDANLLFDEGIGGFHLYGADICLQARQKGMKCYAINAPLEHLSGGNVDDTFYRMAGKLRNKWSQIEGSPNSIETTCGVFALNNSLRARFEVGYKRMRRKIIRRLQRRHIKDMQQ